MSENVDNKIKERKKVFFQAIITVILSMIVLWLIVSVLMTNSKVNQGKFRVDDILVTSSVQIEDTSSETKKWSFNVSQNNKISLLVHASTKEIASVVIKDIAATKQGLSIYQENYEDNKILLGENNSLKLQTTLDDNNNILYEINILNDNLLTNFTIPDGTTEIVHDATILQLAGMKYDDIEFSVSFNLEIQENTGKTNVLKVTLKLPQENIIENGNSVVRLKTSDFVFKVK